MRLIGYCTECHRVRYVRVTGQGMASLAAKGVPQGICQSCEDEAEQARRERRGAR